MCVSELVPQIPYQALEKMHSALFFTASSCHTRTLASHLWVYMTYIQCKIKGSNSLRAFTNWWNKQYILVTISRQFFARETREKREPCGVYLTPMAVGSYYSQSNRRKSAQHSNEGVEGLPTCFSITCTVNRLRRLNMQHYIFLPIRLQYNFVKHIRHSWQICKIHRESCIVHRGLNLQPLHVNMLWPFPQAHIMSSGKCIEKSDGSCSFIMKCAENGWL